MPAPVVPIIGALFTVKAWWPSVMLRCECEAKEPMILAGLGTSGGCPSCGRRYLLEDMFVNKEGDVGVKVSLVILRKAES